MDVDLRGVYAAEARKDELATVNRQRAPELSNALGRGHGFAAEAFVRLSHVVNLAANAIKRREATVILDEATAFLNAKGLVTSRSPGGSADLRAAVAAADPEMAVLNDLYEQLKALRGLVQVKMDGLGRHFYAVQSVYKSTDRTFGMDDGTQKDLSGPGPEPEASGSDTDDFLGTPRYNRY